jgi:hypothetical protein
MLYLLKLTMSENKNPQTDNAQAINQSKRSSIGKEEKRKSIFIISTGLIRNQIGWYSYLKICNIS